LLALALGALATLLILLASYLGPKVCQEVASGAKVLKVCTVAPLEVLVLLYVPTVLLLLPDFSEITFLGIGLKERVDATAAKAEETAAKTDATAAKAEETAATSDATAAKTQSMATRVEEAEVRIGVTEEAAGVANAASVMPAVKAAEAKEPELPSAEELGLPPERTELVARLRALWADRLQPYVRLARRRQFPGWEEFLARLRKPDAGRQLAALDPLDTLLLGSLPATLDDQAIEQIGRWAETNWYLINAVEVTYNAAVAGEDLSSERLKEVLPIGEALRRRLPEKPRDCDPSQARRSRES